MSLSNAIERAAVRATSAIPLGRSFDCRTEQSADLPWVTSAEGHTNSEFRRSLVVSGAFDEVVVAVPASERGDVVT